MGNKKEYFSKQLPKEHTAAVFAILFVYNSHSHLLSVSHINRKKCATQGRDEHFYLIEICSETKCRKIYYETPVTAELQACAIHMRP